MQNLDFADHNIFVIYITIDGDFNLQYERRRKNKTLTQGVTYVAIRILPSEMTPNTEIELVENVRERIEQIA